MVRSLLRLKRNTDPLDNATEYCGAGNRLNVYGKNGSYTRHRPLCQPHLSREPELD
jgi:hypothetical protein